MSAREKEPYELMAKKEKNVKYTSLGVNIAEVEKQENELKQKEQQMKQDTQKIVQLLMQTDSKCNLPCKIKQMIVFVVK